MSKSNKGYLILPYTVYSDPRLELVDKLIFARIHGLTKDEGYCWASNAFLGKELGKTSNYISKVISKLKACGYIDVEVDVNNNNSKRRKIYVNENVLDIFYDNEDINEDDMGISL